MVQTRARGKTQPRHHRPPRGVWTPERARREAGRLLAGLKAGETPRRPGADSPSANGPTIAEMAERYMTEHVAVRCKPTTQRGCRDILDRFLLPKLRGAPPERGHARPRCGAALPAARRRRPWRTRWSRSSPGCSTRPRRQHEAPAGGNPCRFIQKYPTRGRERFLSEQEFDRLGRVLAELEAAGTVSTSAAGALRLLMLTGCRRNEVVTLKWEHVDLEHDELRLRDAKTGARAVPLSPAAKQVLTALPRRPDNPWVFPGRVNGSRLRTLNASWQIIRKEAGLEDVRLHDLRHSFASRALALGESLPMIGKLLGHAKVQTTARYAHLGRNSVKVAAIRISDSLEADMDTPPEVSAAP